MLQTSYEGGIKQTVQDWDNESWTSVRNVPPFVWNWLCGQSCVNNLNMNISKKSTKFTCHCVCNGRCFWTSFNKTFVLSPAKFKLWSYSSHSSSYWTKSDRSVLFFKIKPQTHLFAHITFSSLTMIGFICLDGNEQP